VSGPALVLVGAPGAGKTTIGRVVARRLQLPFRDTDVDVEAVAGKPIADIFVDDGETAFRELERRAVEDALATHQGVLALGGGAVLDEKTRDRLSGLTVVWLEVGLAESTKRVGLARDRPVLALNPRATLSRLLDERKPLYAEVATVTVSTDGRAPDAVADDVISAVS
jgi:shikimate kinase